MNDFSKDELEELSASLSYWINRNQPQSEQNIPLFKKIESMIDSYCEHEAQLEYRLPTHIEELFRGNEDKVLLCKKCERYYL
jgi:hypothetical protein